MLLDNVDNREITFEKLVVSLEKTTRESDSNKC